MIRSFVRGAALAVLACAAVPAQINADGPAISPFRGMRKVDQGIEVQVLDDTWYRLESVAGVDTATLLQEARRLCRPGNDWKRITEDLPALLDAMGHEVGTDVDVRVRSLQNGKLRTFEDVRMTGENRRRVKEAQRGGRRGAAPAVANRRGGTITAAAAREDLQVFHKLLAERFAYRELRPVDLDGLLRRIGAELPDDGLPVERFAAQLDGVLRAFGDGHSRLRGSVGRNERWLPFLIQQVDGGYAAFASDRDGFVSDRHPFVQAIDGVPIERWLLAARERVTRGSEVMQRGQSERLLRNLSELRRALSLPDRDAVAVTLRGESGEHRVELEASRRKPMFGAWPRKATAVLDGNVGYLRIERMEGDEASLRFLDQAMQNFRGTKGLVIDVRGNGGGRRDPLRRLAPYFLPEGEAVVGNVAAFLLEEGKPAPPDALANRYLYRADWDGWNDRQRAAIGAFLRGFRPSWKLPKGRFSPWHFLVLDRSDNDAAFHYDRPVVVLIDRGCFSATDIFAGALQAIDTVTVVGERSAGGSGRARGYQLPNSGVRLQLSTMASFRPDGTLYEGHGVAPDVEVATRATDLIGRTDTALARALELLR
jgi:hypothetical protein